MTTAQTCPSCSAEPPDGARFCPNCGHQLGTEPGPAGTPVPARPRGADERTWAALTHLSAFAAFVFPFFGNIIAPLVIWILKRPHSAVVDEHGKQALNFQISMSIYFIVSALLSFVLIGLPLLVACVVFWVAMVILAAVRASNGEEPGYLLSIKFLK